jgi:hypothetical protein
MMDSHRKREEKKTDRQKKGKGDEPTKRRSQGRKAPTETGKPGKVDPAKRRSQG